MSTYSLTVFPTFSQSELIISGTRETSVKSKKPRGPPAPSGMLDNWEEEDFSLLPQVQKHNAHSWSTTSVGSWHSSDIAMDISPDHASESAIGTGGIPSDDDEVEHQEVATCVVNKSGSVCFRVSEHFLFLKIDILAAFII